jgi:hypothetical protein
MNRSEFAIALMAAALSGALVGVFLALSLAWLSEVMP